MKFSGFLCFLSVYTLSLALPADLTEKDVQTQSPLVMENEDTGSVFPEVDKYYRSKQATLQYRVDKAMHRLKRQASWGIGGSLSIPLEGRRVPSWSVQGHGGYHNPSFGWGARAGIGGEFIKKTPATSCGGYLSGTNRNGITGVLGGGWHSRAGNTFGLGVIED
ncbi:hypothetical protein CHS0354_026294 [Potamilus streckersoni]|uniref:Uncharacterized protein n=1 Tax=Potamilus streckersoni TaxID=2493646 RepID=A0AAE0TFG2_9BIVA|nr:hypothetical protein CHS0354_026294 [Potamilus streckersoni]